MRDIVALLVNKPYNIPLDQVKKLTPYQIAALYLRPRDEYGNIKIECEKIGNSHTPESRFMTWCEFNKIPLWRAKQLWKRRSSRL